MQIEHEEDTPSEQERCRDNAGAPQTQTSFAARLLELDPVETNSVEQGEKNQDERPDGQRREWFEFIRNLSQECRNISPAVSRAVTRI